MPKRVEKLAWTVTSERGDIADIYLVMGRPEGELQITLVNGRTWATKMSLDEICLFAADHERHHVEYMRIYLDEMIRNAEAANRTNQ